MPLFRVRANSTENGVVVTAPSAAAATVRACLEHPDDVGIVVLRASDASARSAVGAPSPEQVGAAVRDLFTAYGYDAVSQAVRELQNEYEAAAAQSGADVAPDERAIEERQEDDRDAAYEHEREAWDPGGDGP